MHFLGPVTTVHEGSGTSMFDSWRHTWEVQNPWSGHYVGHSKLACCDRGGMFPTLRYLRVAVWLQGLAFVSIRSTI